jgi:hypothetical protein
MTTAAEISAVVERTNRQPPQKCHTIGPDSWALCGAYRLRDRGGLHSTKECRAQGHKHCVVCTEMDRQLKGHDGVVRG